MAFVPFARFRNFTLDNLKALLEVYPDQASKMVWSDVINEIEVIMPGYKKTAYQQACQFGLEDRGQDDFRIQKYLYTFDDENLKKYLQFWMKTYYAPNPYVNSDEDPMLIYCELAKEILNSPIYMVDYTDFFERHIGGGSADILMNGLKAHGAPILYTKEDDKHWFYVEQGNVETLKKEIEFIENEFPIVEHKNRTTFFERYTYKSFCKFFGISNSVEDVFSANENDIKKVDVDYLLAIEKNEKFAKEVMRFLIEEVGFDQDMIDAMTSKDGGIPVGTGLPVLLEIPKDLGREEIEALIKDAKGHNRYYSDVYDILNKKYVISNNWYYGGKTGRDNRTPFIEWIKSLLESKGIICKKNYVVRKSGAENILLYGVPGAGKSHTIKTKYCANKKFMERVVFHPDYTYSDFVGQILPRVEKDKDGNDKLKYVFTAGPFTKLLKKAVDDPQNYYYLVIEELNRGNAPAIFGEIFQLLDRKDEDEYPAEEVGESEYFISNYDVADYVYKNADEEVRIPSNMFILATMNTADQNVFTLDTAFQRRWHMKQIENSFDKAEHSKDLIEGTRVNWGAFATVINETIIENNADMVSSEDKRLGTFFAKKKELETSRFPEKVLKYLWDDAFKMDRTAVFNESCKSLEDVVSRYEIAPIDKLSSVLRAEIYNKMFSKMKEAEVIEEE